MNASENTTVAILLRGRRYVGYPPRNDTYVVDRNIAAQRHIDPIAPIPQANYRRCSTAEGRVRREIILMVGCW